MALETLVIKVIKLKMMLQATRLNKLLRKIKNLELFDLNKTKQLYSNLNLKYFQQIRHKLKQKVLAEVWFKHQ